VGAVSRLIKHETGGGKMELHPTLWRTCRVLAGTTRLRLLRLVYHKSDRSVSEMAGLAGISVPRASQELRRLNSRGLMQAVRKGREVCYRLVPDPQVPDAAPLLEAVLQSLGQSRGKSESTCRRIAIAFAHPRRLSIIRALLQGPSTFNALMDHVRFTRATLHRHLLILRSCRMVQLDGGRYHWIPDPHPMARALALLSRP
jgi:DNA-binding transcriptional ArsR family regulator